MPGFFYTRHARRRMQLYEVSEEDVEEAVQNPEAGPEIEEGRLVVQATFPNRFKGKPLKVIYVIEDESVTILSVYPLKKAHRG